MRNLSEKRCAILLIFVFVAAYPVFPVSAWQHDHVAESTRNMVASVHPLATQAGVRAMEQGGNAIDAAVAAGLMLSVVDGYNSGIGGGCFVLIRTADGKFYAVDGREMAAAAAHRDMYLVDGKPNTDLSQTGALAIGVPGALKAYEKVVKEHGKLEFSKLVRPAEQVANDGFVVSDLYARQVAGARKKLARFPGSKAVLLKQDGSPIQAGDRLVQTDLANTLNRIAEEGTKYYYRGEFATTLAQWMSENGGVITADDMRNYRTVSRKPVQSTYRNHKIVGFPPPSSGGVHVAQILNILERFDLKGLYYTDRAAFVHVIAEAMKLAFADRAYWMGDPDFAKVPLGLIDKEYAADLAARISMTGVTAVDSHGTPPSAEARFFERHTTHVTAADKEGNWVAMTTTNNTTFGSKVIVPGLGVVMNNQMDDFSIAPGTPNAYGLVGTEANSIQPGKRPLSSMSPSIILDENDQPIMTVGAAGGPRIITQALLAIIRRVDLNMSVGQALAEKRFHHQWAPDVLSLERGFDPTVAQALEKLGHKIQFASRSGVSQAIVWDVDQDGNGRFIGSHDPRVPGLAAGSKIP